MIEQKIKEYLSDFDNLLNIKQFPDVPIKDAVHYHKEMSTVDFLKKGREFIRQYLMVKSKKRPYKYVVVCRGVDYFFKYYASRGLSMFFLRSFVNRKDVLLVNHWEQLRAIDDIGDVFLAASESDFKVDSNLSRTLDFARERHARFVPENHTGVVPWGEFIDSEFESWRLSVRQNL